MFTESRLTFAEIKSWSDITNRPISHIEVEAIRQLDLIYWRNAHG